MTGMLWFDNQPAPLAAKVQLAIDYYHSKYGKKPSHVYCSPADYDPLASVPGVTIKPLKVILHCHLWIGTEAQS